MFTWVLIAFSALTAPPLQEAAPSADVYRLTAKAFGQEIILEVNGPPKEEAQSALSAALAEVRAVERLLNPDGSEPGGLGPLNRASGSGLVQIDPRLGEILKRAAAFCDWSGGAFGPLGGHLNELWRTQPPTDANLGTAEPTVAANLAAAIARGRCELLTLGENQQRAELTAGARADLFGFGVGFAVDRAVTILGYYGIKNGNVRIGSTMRGFGPGADGKGWQAPLSDLASLGNPEGSLWLLDRSLAVAANTDGITPYIHHRKGAPTEGVMAVLVSTELAADSQGLASTLFVTGSRDGQMHLGALKPAPAVRWLLGRGYGQPLVVDYHWTDVSRGAP